MTTLRYAVSTPLRSFDILAPYKLAYYYYYYYYNTIQYNTIQCSSSQSPITWPTVRYTSLNIWDNSYEEKAQLNKCHLSARLKAR